MTIADKIELLFHTDPENVNISFRDIELLEGEVRDVINNIKNCETFSLAEKHLIVLVEYHSILAKLLFKYRLNIGEYLERITRAYDRWDDDETRKNFYNQVRNASGAFNKTR